VSLVDQWRQIESELPEAWGDARLRLTITDEADCDRAAALLGPINPGRRGKQLRFFVARRRAGPGPDQIRRLLRRLDAAHVDGRLELVGTSEPEVVPPTARPTLAASWDAELAALPSDWTDLYAELELASTDYLERAALLLSPLNPARYGGKPGFRCRCARRFGYGASPRMVRRCLERCDEEDIRGTIRVLWALSDTHPVGTQGPVWYVGGRAV
jgi:hypothetical protein